MSGKQASRAASLAGALPFREQRLELGYGLEILRSAGGAFRRD